MMNDEIPIPIAATSYAVALSAPGGRAILVKPDGTVWLSSSEGPVQVTDPLLMGQAFLSWVKEYTKCFQKDPS